MTAVVRTYHGAASAAGQLIVIEHTKRVAAGEMLSIADVKEILGLEVIGVIPESADVLSASNAGTPVILNDGTDVSEAYGDAVARLLGEERELRFIDEPKKSFFSRMFGG